MTTAQFAHLRLADATGEIYPKGGATIALTQDGNNVKGGIAVCHIHDHFVKKHGRQRALGRLASTADKFDKYRFTVENTNVDFVLSVIYAKEVNEEIENTVVGALRRAGAHI